MKKLLMCDEHAYHITDEDYEKLKTISPGYARLAKESDNSDPTHFVCEICGQVPPLKLREMHECQMK
ncbi:MAG: hypothetical protein M1133_00120 [Armatimonadetes bacterium]|nr:hypothetical protein [Armatimonadota bacterium]